MVTWIRSLAIGWIVLTMVAGSSLVVIPIGGPQAPIAPALKPATPLLRENGLVAGGGSPVAPHPFLPVSLGGAAPFSIPHLAFHGATPPHIPSAWGAGHLPPGAPVPRAPPGVPQNRFLSDWSNNGSYHYVAGACYGRWTALGQSSYTGGCYGHDEPAINPFSNLPGSGGNVSWNVRLPVDRSATQNQSLLYTAIWFGMDLYDPFGYNGQCFLEVQLYPDTNGSGLPQPGVWSGFAVGWQIELATGSENPCFAAPLNVGTSSVPFQMNQGDHLNVTMTGWVGSPFGENISVRDQTTGQVSRLNLFNSTGNYPLNPAYSENNIHGSLPWSPGGDLPVAFSFETGHTLLGPSNDSFGGCNAGPPPSTPLNPGTPCDSYDPHSWAQDTLTPWEIYPPVFFNAHERQAAAQEGFEQDFGGIAWIDPSSSGTCAGRDGSAFCSYPWYSYNAHARAFEFGATDYSGTTQDFGQYLQYPQSLQADTAGLSFFPVANFTASADPGNTLAISVIGSGTVRFLNHVISSSTTLTNLPSGSYSINAVPSTGRYFSGYGQSGGAVMDTSRSAWSSLELSGNGHISATFSTSPPMGSPITFRDSPNHGFVTLVPGFSLVASASYPGLPGVGTAVKLNQSAFSIPSGGTRSLTPGIYSLLAQPSPGYEFKGWTVSGAAYVFTAASNYTWVNLTGGAAIITGHYHRSVLLDTIWLYTVPSQGGTVTFNGVSYVNNTVLTVPVGTYTLSAHANASYRFGTWGYSWSASMLNFSRTTFVELQNGSSYVAVVFLSTPHVAAVALPSGWVALAGQIVSGPVTLPQSSNGVYPLQAIPSAGHQFLGWSVAPSTNLSVLNASRGLTLLYVSGGGTVTARFGRPLTPLAHLTFDAARGSIEFNGISQYSGTHVNHSVARGVYSIAAIAGPGRSFTGWSALGGLTIRTTYYLDGQGVARPWYSLVVRGSGTVVAHFGLDSHPVTFIDFPSVTGTYVSVNGGSIPQFIHSGQTGSLLNGTYLVTLGGGKITHVHWFATSNLTLSSNHGKTIRVTVRGSGALYAIAVSHPAVGAAWASPSAVRPHHVATVSVIVLGGTEPYTYSFAAASWVPSHRIHCTPASTTSPRSEARSACWSSATGSYAIVVTVTDAWGFSTSQVVPFHVSLHPVPAGVRSGWAASTAPHTAGPAVARRS